MWKVFSSVVKTHDTTVTILKYIGSSGHIRTLLWNRLQNLFILQIWNYSLNTNFFPIIPPFSFFFCQFDSSDSSCKWGHTVLSFCDGCISLSITSLSFIYIVACNRILFFLIIVHWMYFIHLPFRWTFGVASTSWLLWIVCCYEHGCAIVFSRLSFQFFGWILRSGIAGFI
jgi:hypothetical protein